MLHLGGPNLVFSTHLLTDDLKAGCLYGEYSESKVLFPHTYTEEEWNKMTAEVLLDEET